MKNILILILLILTPELFSEDIIDPTSSYELDSLQYKNKLDTIVYWTKVDTLEVFESTEGGVIYYFYLGNEVKKIECHYYGETGKSVINYYLGNDKLKLAEYVTYKYNRPKYYDSLDMIENNDSVYFNVKKSRIDTAFFYFKKDEINEFKNSMIKYYDSTLLSKQDILIHFNEVINKNENNQLGK